MWQDFETWKKNNVDQDDCEANSQCSAGLCAKCGVKTDKLFTNGDGKDKCESCAVEDYKRGIGHMLWPKQETSLINPGA